MSLLMFEGVFFFVRGKDGGCVSEELSGGDACGEVHWKRPGGGYL